MCPDSNPSETQEKPEGIVRNWVSLVQDSKKAARVPSNFWYPLPTEQNQDDL